MVGRLPFDKLRAGPNVRYWFSRQKSINRGNEEKALKVDKKFCQMTTRQIKIESERENSTCGGQQLPL